MTPEDHLDGTSGLAAVLAPDTSAFPETEYTSRSDRRRQQRTHLRRRRRRGKRSLIILLAVVLVGGGTFGAYGALKPLISGLTESNDYAGPGTGTAAVTIPSGASGRAIARLLEQAGVVKSARAAVDAQQENPRSGSIQPGQYVLRQHMSGSSAVALMLDPKSRTGKGITIREGLRASEITALLSRSTGHPAAEYAAALRQPEALGLPATARGKVEGWLFPDTYQFGRDMSAAEQLRRMVSRTRDELDDLKIDDAQAQRVLTIASIAEVEGGSRTDFAKVARVIENRLAANGVTVGRLQMDSTVAYGLGRRVLTTSTADRSSGSPYNTYRVKGLPPGPISNPGRAAIEGALGPTPGPWLFFVTVNPKTGETKFASTYSEHQRNVAQFRTWCQAHAGTC